MGTRGVGLGSVLSIAVAAFVAGACSNSDAGAGSADAGGGEDGGIGADGNQGDGSTAADAPVVDSTTPPDSSDVGPIVEGGVLLKTQNLSLGSAAGGPACPVGAIDTGHTAYQWGADPYDSPTNKASNTMGTNVVAISSDATYGGVNCYLDSAGAAFCWGPNDLLGTGTDNTTVSSTPQAVTMPAGVTFATISTGSGIACGLTAGGDAYCWGNNNAGQCGTGTISDAGHKTVLTPTLVTGGNKWKWILAGNEWAMGVRTDGAAMFWGNNSGIFSPGLAAPGGPTPAAIGLNVAFETLAGGAAGVCGLDASGTAYCWGGDNTLYGNGTTSKGSPVNGGPYSKIAVGAQAACAVSGTTLMCWGKDSREMGQGINGPSQPTPVAVPGHSFVDVAMAIAGGACAIDDAGAVWCWATNASVTMNSLVKVSGSTVFPH